MSMLKWSNLTCTLSAHRNRPQPTLHFAALINPMSTENTEDRVATNPFLTEHGHLPELLTNPVSQLPLSVGFGNSPTHNYLYIYFYLLNCISR